MKNIYNSVIPELIIAESFDSIIREIEIFTEKELLKYSNDRFGVRTRLNQARDEMIAELKKSEKVTIEYYQSIRDQLTKDDEKKQSTWRASYFPKSRLCLVMVISVLSVNQLF